MICIYCKAGLSSLKSFIPLDKPGIPNRKWACTDCANLIQKTFCKKEIGKTALEISRIFDPNFLKEDSGLV